MTRIMVSYRREDSSGWAGRTVDRLVARFGVDQVFIDVDTIKPGMNFVVAIDQAVRSANVMLVLIGPRFLTVTNDAGEPRLFQAGDYLRVEIETALSRHLPIVPVLVDGAEMPEKPELPATIAGLSEMHAQRLDAVGFNRDVEDLIEALERWIARGEPTGPQARIDLSDRTDPPPESWLMRLRRHRKHVLAGAGVCIAAGTILAIAALGGGDGGEPRIVATVDVGDEPLAVAGSPEGMWVSHRHRNGTVSRIDPASNEVAEQVDVADVALGDIVYGFDSLWVVREDNAVSRVALTDRTVRTVPLTTRAVDLAVDGGSVWVSGVDGTIGRIDAAGTSFTVVDKMDMPAGFGPGDVETDDEVATACTGERVFVSHRGAKERPDDSYIRALDPDSSRGRNLHEAVGLSPVGLAAGFGALWVANSGDGTVSRIDPCSNARNRVVHLDGVRPWGVAVGRDAVWTTNKGHGSEPAGSVSRIDPEAVVVTLSLPVGADPDGITVDSAGHVWAVSTADDAVFRIDPDG